MSATRIPRYVTPVNAWTVLAVTVVPVQLVLADLIVKTVSTHNALIFAKYTHISVNASYDTFNGLHCGRL